MKTLKSTAAPLARPTALPCQNNEPTQPGILKTLKILFLILISWGTLSCQHDDPLQKGTVQFSFGDINKANAGGRKQTDEVPDGSSVIISLAKSNGDTVFTWKKMALLAMGDKFFTEPLALLKGDYVITDFIIVGPNGAMLFLTPKQGSPLANLIQRPIPISFSVTADAIANTEVEVIDANHRNPEDFGYVSFPIKIISAGFSLSVFVVGDNGDAVLTDADAYILHQQDTVVKKHLAPLTNTMVWNSDSTATYTLVIVKDGYAKYVKEFTPEGLNNALAGQPLIVVLTPAVTITWSAYLVTSPPAFSPNLFMAGNVGSKVRVDWGDGASENVELVDYHTSVNALYHTYASAGKYFVSVTGDLAAIQEFYMQPYTATIHDISLSSLPEVRILYFSHLIFKKPTIDVSKNTKLFSLNMFNDIGFSSLDISKNSMLTNLGIQENQLSTEVINKIIDDLYQSVTTSSRGGILNLSRYASGNEIEGPPSEAQVNKLNTLINGYGWAVYPITQH